MTITPDELRNVTFRESLRGYHRTDVDALCERAAETIEQLEQQIRALRQGLGSDNGDDGGAVRLVQPAERAVHAPESDVIQRTLILAQRAADEAVAEAQDRARALTTESEAKANALVSEAESTARRIGEDSRRRVESEVHELSTTRDLLIADVDALERFAEDFRGRIRRAISSELARLEESSPVDVEAPPRPELETAGAHGSASGSPPPHLA